MARPQGWFALFLALGLCRARAGSLPLNLGLATARGSQLTLQVCRRRHHAGGTEQLESRAAGARTGGSTDWCGRIPPSRPYGDRPAAAALPGVAGPPGRKFSATPLAGIFRAPAASTRQEMQRLLPLNARRGVSAAPRGPSPGQPSCFSAGTGASPLPPSQRRARCRPDAARSEPSRRARLSRATPVLRR